MMERETCHDEVERVPLEGEPKRVRHAELRVRDAASRLIPTALVTMAGVRSTPTISRTCGAKAFVKRPGPQATSSARSPRGATAARKQRTGSGSFHVGRRDEALYLRGELRDGIFEIIHGAHGIFGLQSLQSPPVD